MRRFTGSRKAATAVASGQCRRLPRDGRVAVGSRATEQALPILALAVARQRGAIDGYDDHPCRIEAIVESLAGILRRTACH